MKRLFWLIIGVGILGLGAGALALSYSAPKLPKYNGRILQARPPQPTGTFQVNTSTLPKVKKLPIVQFFGDIMLDRNVKKVMATSGLDYILGEVENTEFFGEAEIKIANLEGPFAEKRISTTKEIAFAFDPALVKDLVRYGFSAFNLANNHSYDMRKQNLLFTRKLLSDNGIGWFGDELSESSELTWYATSSDGTRLAFIGVHNTYHKPDRNKLKNIIKEAKEKSDLVVVNVHWGEEYKTESNKSQREFGHWFIDNGVDLVIGHHPHVVQEVEIYKGKPILYSLGNFIFDQYFSKETQEGISVKAVLTEKQIASLEIIPFKSRKSKIVEMADYEKEKFFESFVRTSRLEDKQIIDGKITF